MMIPLFDLVVVISLVTCGTAGILWEATKTATGWRLIPLPPERHDFVQFGLIGIHVLTLLVGGLWAISTRVLMPIIIGAGFGIVLGLIICWIGWHLTRMRSE